MSDETVSYYTIYSVCVYMCVCVCARACVCVLVCVRARICVFGGRGKRVCVPVCVYVV